MEEFELARKIHCQALTLGWLVLGASIFPLFGQQKSCRPGTNDHIGAFGKIASGNQTWLAGNGGFF